MAQAFPSVILDSVLKQLGDPIFQSNKLHLDFRIQLRDLESKLELIRSVIDEAELMAVLFPKFVGEWVCELQNVLYVVDNVFDEAFTRSRSASDTVARVRLHLYNLPFGFRIVPKMKRINKRLDSIVKQCSECNLIQGDIANPNAWKGILRYDPDYVRDEEFEMSGRDDDKRKVIEMLFNEDPTVAVVGITGRAGVGKTTLCRAVYNDEDVKNHFQNRLWVGFGNVSEFSAVSLWKKILTALEPEKAQTYPEIDEEDQLKGILSSFIGNTKTLLVLDDLMPGSDVSLDKFWSGLKTLIGQSPSNSKILLAQLKLEPSMMLKTDYVRELGDAGLSEEHSWSIFEKICGRLEWRTDLEKQIVSGCAGNPAVLKGVGTFLYGKEDRGTWEYFARDFDFHELYDRYDKISKVSRLFPKCHQYVGYLSLFKEAEFKYEDLIHQFEAHGFPELPYTMRERLERALFSQTVEDTTGTDESRYTVGIQNGDWIPLVAGAESTTLRWTDDNHLKEARHVSISSSTVPQQHNGTLPDSLIEDALHRRSLLFFGESFPSVIRVQALDMLFSGLRNLRVLSLQDLRLRTIPSSIGNLVHLKYLSLSGNNFRTLPTSVCALKHLWTLNLIYCSELKRFPGRITNLSHLRHLEINLCMDLIYMPSTIARLTSLERLDRFVVSSRKGGMRYLENLNRLRGHLSIELPRRWKDSIGDSEKARLESKQGLTSLELKWHGAYDGNCKDHDVLERLKPCSRLENLVIVNFGGTEFPSWFTSLEHLTKITLSRCANCNFLPAFRTMPNLKGLTLVLLMNLEYLEEDHHHNDASCAVPSAATAGFFSSLKLLRIGKMPRLRGWWSRNQGRMPRFSDIEVVEIWCCPCLREMMPPFSTIEQQLILQDVDERAIQSIDWEENERAEIISIQGMVSLPSEFVARLPKKLTVKDCNQWERFWTHDGGEGSQAWESLEKGFQRVEHLAIENCRAMKFLSSALIHLNNLRSLKISECSEELDCLFKWEDDDEGETWKALRALREFRIKGFRKLSMLPPTLQYLPPLFEFEINDCNRLRSLGMEIGWVPKVECLTVISCPLLSTSIERFKRERRGVRVVFE